MRAFAKIVSAAALATATLSSAHAGVYVYNFAGNNNSNSYGTPGNTISSTATSGTTSVSMIASAWSTISGNTVASWLGNYPEGLGVKNAAGDQNSVDNFAGVDFVLLQFSRPVSLTSAFVTSKGYPAFGQPVKDADFIASFGNTSATLAGSIVSTVAPNFTGLRAIATGGETGKFWAITAGGTDRTWDSFKIGQITATAVPEPATWALMILGMGAIGVALRSRRAKAAKVSYAF